jgi:hypothetical protein
MAANGADYNIIHSYLIEQRKGSWKPECCAMKYFLLQQRQNPSDQDKYFLKEGKDVLEESANTVLNVQNLDKYTKTVAMYKAFTAIALMKTQFDGKDLESVPPTCVLQRGMRRDSLIKMQVETESSAMLAYADVDKGQTFKGMSPAGPVTVKGGIAESTALGSPALNFTEAGYDVHQMKIPFSRIHAVYFMSPELCCDDDRTMKLSPKGFSMGHEFVCDLRDLALTLIKKADRKAGIPKAPYNPSTKTKQSTTTTSTARKPPQ